MGYSNSMYVNKGLLITLSHHPLLSYWVTTCMYWPPLLEILNAVGPLYSSSCQLACVQDLQEGLAVPEEIGERVHLFFLTKELLP